MELDEVDTDTLELSESMAKYPNEIKFKHSQLPIFFTFDDPKDPSTIREVDINNLYAVFGNGYDFKYISLQLTDEDMTKGQVIKDFPWLSGKAAYFNYYYTHKTENAKLMKALSKNDLIRHWKCVVDPYQMKNLTFGIYEKGLGCDLSS